MRGRRTTAIASDGTTERVRWRGHDGRTASRHQVTTSRRTRSRRPTRKWSPVVFALERLFPKRGRAPYATAERAVVLVIVRAMSFDDVGERVQLLSQLSDDREVVRRESRVGQTRVAEAQRRACPAHRPVEARSHARLPPRVLSIHARARSRAFGDRSRCGPRGRLEQRSKRCATCSLIVSPYSGSDRTSAAR